MAGGKREEESLSLAGPSATALDAAAAKAKAAQKSLFHDPFAAAFTSHNPTRAMSNTHSPIMNRGHYLRVKLTDQVLETFCDLVGRDQAQVVSLGAGFDTRYWRIQKLGKAPRLYIELDLPNVVSLKRDAARSNPQLLAAFPDGVDCFNATGTPGIYSPRSGYVLSATDICDTNALSKALCEAGWNADAPTLVLAELVLAYLPNDPYSFLPTWFANKGSNLVFLALEPTNVSDAFGLQMLENLRVRGCPLLGLATCPNLAAQIAKFKTSGWTRVEANDFYRVYEHAIDANERARVQQLEPLDEVEEWRLMFRHYAVLLSVKEVPNAQSLFDALNLDNVSIR